MVTQTGTFMNLAAYNLLGGTATCLCRQQHPVLLVKSLTNSIYHPDCCSSSADLFIDARLWGTSRQSYKFERNGWTGRHEALCMGDCKQQQFE